MEKSLIPDSIKHSVSIEAEPIVVWSFLTDIDKMKQWMGEEEMKINIQTDWTIGNPISISGFHHIQFENKGTVLHFDIEKKLCYTHLSTLSRLSDIKEHYTILTFLLKQIGGHTELLMQIENFPTDSIYRHLNFYWAGTLFQLKELIEDNLSNVY